MQGASQVALVGKNLLASEGDTGDEGSILELGRYPGEGNGNPLQYSCLENPRDRGAWQATIHGVANSWTWLSTYAHTHAHAHTDDVLEVEQCLQQKLEGWGVGWLGRWGVGEETWIGRLQSPELNILELNPPATFLGAKCSGVLCCHIN